MEELNQTIFLMINASAHPHPLMLAVAQCFAEWAIWVIPLLLMLGWLRGSERLRKQMLEAAVSGLTGLLFNQFIGLLWQHPRPVMVGLGHTFLAHSVDSSFPSDHLTLIWAVAFSLLLHQRLRTAGLLLALLGLPVAWARIYLGVHFPLDMVGATLVALVCSQLVRHEGRFVVEHLYQPLLVIFRLLAAPLIRRGWIVP